MKAAYVLDYMLALGSRGCRLFKVILNINIGAIFKNTLSFFFFFFLEGTASPDVPDLRGLCLHPVPNVPWQQDVRVPQLLHGFLQSPQVYFLQRERPAGLRELQPVRMLSAWSNKPHFLPSGPHTGTWPGLKLRQWNRNAAALSLLGHC